MIPTLAILGAGLSGITLANALRDHFTVTLFEKSRGPGGRMSTRRAEPFFFDHGTQFFTARSQAFQAFLRPHLASGLVQEWQGKVITLESGKAPTKRLWFEPHYVACPGMNQLCKTLAEDLHVQLGAEIQPIQQSKDGWQLTDQHGQARGVFDWVISTAPPTQTRRLFDEFIPPNAPLHEAKMQGCFSLMLGFNQTWEESWIAAKVPQGPLGWISANSTKPLRDRTTTCIVAHTTNAWAEAHIDHDRAEIEKQMVDELKKLSNIRCDRADYHSLHRWRYACTQEGDALGTFIDQSAKLAAIGDWGTASRIEDVWQQAARVASSLISFHHAEPSA
jgi:renalase